MGYRYCFIIIFFLVGVNQAKGQFRIPSFEVALKGGYLNIGDDRYIENKGYSVYSNYESIFSQGEINFHIGQHIALGYFHQRSVYSDFHSSGDWNDNNNFSYEGKQLIHGLNLRFSTGRTSRWRPYAQFKYFLSQFVVDYEGFKVSREGPGAGAGIGLMLRMGHKVYLNLIEAEVTTLLSESDVLFTEKGTIFLTARTGITYNFSKRK